MNDSSERPLIYPRKRPLRPPLRLCAALSAQWPVLTWLSEFWVSLTYPRHNLRRRAALHSAVSLAAKLMLPATPCPLRFHTLRVLKATRRFFFNLLSGTFAAGFSLWQTDQTKHYKALCYHATNQTATEVNAAVNLEQTSGTHSSVSWAVLSSYVKTSINSSSTVYCAICINAP